MSYCKHNFILSLFWLITGTSIGQSVYYQDIIGGGVTGAGMSFCLGSGVGTIPIYIEPGSSINRAFLISYRYWYEPMPLECDYQFTLNSDTIVLSDLNRVTPILNNQPGAYFINHVVDITSIVDSSISSYSLTMPGGPCYFYNSVFLVFIYSNNLLGVSNVVITINEKDNEANVNYFIGEINPINTNCAVGFSVFSDRLGSVPEDGDTVIINNERLGYIGGVDNINAAWNCGVKGHFYFQDSTLVGLDDDTPDSIVAGSDGLADIKSYLPNGVSSFLVTRKYHEPIGVGQYSDFFPSFHLAYITPCDTFSAKVSKDVLLCSDDSTLLNAYGGIKYKWKPNIGLSCDTCASTWAKPDSSILYTCTIYNNDSCTKVLPVKVNIHKPILFDSLITTATCGLADGSVAAINIQNNIGYVNYTLNGIQQPTSTFSNLNTGNYYLGVIDSIGCADSIPVFIPEVININAGFNANPLSGTVPIDVNFTNTTMGASNYIWNFGDGNTSTLTNPVHTYNLADTFQVMLVAWVNDSSCTDTAYTTLIHEPGILINQLVTNNNDGKNDTWIIEGLINYPQHYVAIYNRWGNVVFETNNYQNNWYGYYNGSPLPVGTYFYVIYLEGKSNNDNNLVKSGYIELTR